MTLRGDRAARSRPGRPRRDPAMREDGAPVGQPEGRLLRLQTQVGLTLGGLVFVTAIVLAAVLSSTAESRVLRISAENLENLSAQMARELSAGMDSFLRDVQDQ